MTKTIKIPLSKETCHIIKHRVGWFLWISATIGAICAIYVSATSPTFWGLVPLPVAGAGFSILVMIWHLRNTDHWIEFQCNCENNESTEPSSRGGSHP